MKFEFRNPTHLIFGVGTLARLGEVVGKHGKKALIVTGGGSMPKDQTAFGVCDLITHVTEGVILTAMEWGPMAVADGSDLEARTQVQWASVVALNGWVQVGTDYGFPVHLIEHALSAHHDIAHGAGLAVVNPAWMRFAAKTRSERFAQFAQFRRATDA